MKTFGHSFNDQNVGQREKRKKTGTVSSDKRKSAHSERIKQVWAQRKENLDRQIFGYKGFPKLSDQTLGNG